MHNSTVQKQLPACKSCLASSIAADWSTLNDSSLLAQHNDTIKRLKLPDVSEIKSSSNVLLYTAIIKYHDQYIEAYLFYNSDIIHQPTYSLRMLA